MFCMDFEVLRDAAHSQPKHAVYSKEWRMAARVALWFLQQGAAVVALALLLAGICAAA